MLLAIIFLPVLIAFAAYSAGRKNERARDIITFAAVTFTFAASIIMALYYRNLELRLADWGAVVLHFRADGFRVLYACVIAFMWLVTSIFSPEYLAHSRNRNRYWLLNLITLGSVMGVFFSADFRTAYLFFEIMSLCSYTFVAHDESPKTLRAAETYLAVSIISGFVQLMGMLLLLQRAGTLEFAALYELSAGMQDKSYFYLPGALLLVGFTAKAGMYPLHIWLPKAHPVAPAPASALLSGILTKTGVFGVIAVTGNIFLNDAAWGIALIIPAAITMIFGASMAVVSNDLKRTLACSSISQIGFILTGVAMLGLSGGNNALAAHGTLLHMLNHSLFKLLLFLVAGIVYMNRHELALDKIRGFGRGKPLFFFVFLMAALGICGIPLWSGYVSKTLLHKALSESVYLYQGWALEYPLRFAYMAMVFTGALTFAYMAKLFVTLFVSKGDAAATDEKRYISLPSAIALALSAALIPLLGSFTWVMDSLAVFGEGFFHGHAPLYIMPYFAWANIRGAVISISMGAVIYLLVVRGLMAQPKIIAAIWPAWLGAPIGEGGSRLDLENLIYRPILRFLTFNAILRSSGRKPHSPGRFLSLYYLKFCRRLRLLHNNPSIIGHFSLDLLFVGAGTCIALVYLLIKAFYH